jgi:hypothetical protein
MTDRPPRSRRSEPDEERPASLRTLITVLVTVGLLAGVIAVVAVASFASSSTRTAANRIDISGDSQLVIRSTDADVRLVEGTSSDVVIRAKVTSGLIDTKYELRRRGDEVEVVGTCMSWLSPGCGVDVTVAVPPRLPVLVATDSADVLAEGLSGHVVTIATGSGDVSGHQLAVQELSAKTDSGDVDTVFVKQPFALKATTKSGDVTARIPEGQIQYAVAIKAGSGSVKSALTSAPDGQGIVRVVSDSGDVVLKR